MPLVVADRVKETTTTTGTGTITLAGAVTGFQSFAVIGNDNTTYYTIASQSGTEWEVGIGTYISSGTTLIRTTVLSSSNSGNLVNFSAGTKDVFVTYPASRFLNRSAEVATTSGTTVTLATGIPAGTIRVNVGLYGVSVNNTSRIIVQFGTGSTPTYVTSGYSSTADNYSSAAGPVASLTNGFAVSGTNAAATLWYVNYQFLNIGSNQWVGNVGGFNTNSAGVVLGGGAVTLGAELTAVRLTTTAGTGVFDGGSASILYE